MTGLNALLLEAGMEPLAEELAQRFGTYLDLLMKWNAKLNLTSLRLEEEILRRHFVECIFCARHLPIGLGTLLDYGSGAGFPGLPIALCRPEIGVTLAESQGKKCAFLREAVRSLELQVAIHCGRAEALDGKFDMVTVRAVERMGEAIMRAGCLVREGGALIVMTTEGSRAVAVPGVEWGEAIRLPGLERGILLVGNIGSMFHVERGEV